MHRSTSSGRPIQSSPPNEVGGFEHVRDLVLIATSFASLFVHDLEHPDQAVQGDQCPSRPKRKLNDLLVNL